LDTDGGDAMLPLNGVDDILEVTDDGDEGSDKPSKVREAGDDFDNVADAKFKAGGNGIDDDEEEEEEEEEEGKAAALCVGTEMGWW
jgi:hypothetical protein